ncbi:hypothetical protein K435DRAFT_874899 [Dendrothele bispora CBS 962.96]|uniref:Uncharacterized protein n=1 Tax=Dendrothele bispora (strain CBS 962.96) TaxID=1314807 RepID=A0A4S8KVL3_DENBC|nr:hypothetical protein K435DRAFT_874899 [Dendrothele bispora CBS 962.96]
MNPENTYPTGAYLLCNPPRIVRNLPAYLDIAIRDDDRRMIFFIISNTPRYQRLHLCPGYIQSGKPYHRLTMLPMGFDVDFFCDYCERPRPRYLLEDEQRHLCRLSEKYRARFEYRYEMTADGPVYLPATRPLSPSPPASPVPFVLPPSPPVSPSQPQVSEAAGPTTQQEHPQGPPPPYTPPVLSIAGFTGVGTSDDPFNLDSVTGTGSSTDPIDLCGDDEE